MTTHSIDFATGSADPKQFRNALGRFATGITVITTCTPSGKCEGMTANSFSAVSLDPPLILWSIRNEAPSLASFLEAEAFAINILTQEQASLSHHFASPSEDKFADIEVSKGYRDCPLISGALAHFECALEKAIPAGDHQIMLGRVMRAGYDAAAQPLLFSTGRYAIAAPLPNMDATADLATMWDGLG